MGVLLSVIFLMNTCLLWIVSGGTNTPNFILRCLQPISLYETEEIQNRQVLKSIPPIQWIWREGGKYG